MRRKVQLFFYYDSGDEGSSIKTLQEKIDAWQEENPSYLILQIAQSAAGTSGYGSLHHATILSILYQVD